MEADRTGMKTRNALIIVVLTACLTLVGCPNKGAPNPAGNAPSGDTGASNGATRRAVTISSISPSPDKPLQVGSKTRIEMGIEYTVPSPGGILGIVIQDSNNSPVKSNLKEVPSGSGTITSEIEFVVPNAKHIDVHVPLYVKGETKSSQVAVKQFKINPR